MEPNPALAETLSATFDVDESSQVAEVRRMVARFGRATGMDDKSVARAELVATEMCTNLVKYGSNGRLTVDGCAGPVPGVSMVAVDSGPGFVDFARSSQDGHSTGGSLGIGLGAIMRRSDFFDVYTAQGQGSAILAMVTQDSAAPDPHGAICCGHRAAPKRGETVSGDAWGFVRGGRRHRLCVVDGLGHGPAAAEAAQAAVQAFHAAAEAAAPQDILRSADTALQGSRGAVMAVAVIDEDLGILTFAGIGNICAGVCTHGTLRHIGSAQGIVGYRTRAVRQYEFPWDAGSVAILSSDGLARWDMRRYPGLLQRHPALLASVLFRDCARDSDDATVVAVRRPA